MEALFRALIVGLVPQPTQLPPPPFEREDLQRIFGDVSRSFPYDHFAFLPGDQGAQFFNPPEDRVLLQPQLLQVQCQVGGASIETAERARMKAVSVLKTAVERLSISEFLACGIKVIAHVPAPPEGAREFVSKHLFSQSERIEDIGPGFFGGGLKLRKIDSHGEEVLLIEPLLVDDKFIWIDFDVQRRRPFASLDDLGEWIDDAIRFVKEPAIAFLKEAA